MASRMTADQLIDLHRTLCGRARDLITMKNQDYRGGDQDTFANFRGAAALGIDPIVGILLRCMDKFQRIRSFATTGTLAVKSESFEDAVVDVINYMVLAAGMAEERSSHAVASGTSEEVLVPDATVTQESRFDLKALDAIVHSPEKPPAT